MKAAQPLRYPYVGIPLLFLLVISPVGMVVAAGAAAAPAACTDLTLSKTIAKTPINMTQQSAVDIAQSSSQYEALTSGVATVAFSGVGNEWTFSRTHCTVSLQSLSVDFVVKASNGSSYILSAIVNPKLEAVTEVNVLPWASGSLNVGTGTAYSGYGVCAGSGCSSTYALLGVTTDFNEPTVSQPSGTYLEQTEPNCHLTEGICEAVFWAGLANCDYTGMPWSGCSGTVIQTGTAGVVKYNSTTDQTFISYYAWGEKYSSSSGVGFDPCTSDNPSPSNGGDSMESQVLNEYLTFGTTGTDYDTYTYDNTAGWVCENVFSSTYSPVYAEYIAERPQNTTSCGSSCGANSQFTLPDFSSFSFSSDQLYYTSWNGAYNDYNGGYGFGVQMENSYGGSNYQNTVTDSMSPQTIDGVNYGSFTVGYDDSIGT